MRENELNNYYNMLGLTSQASIEEIEEAYAKLSRKYAQLLETGVGLVGEKQKAEVDFEIITLAYNALIDDRRREHYDSLLPQGVKTWDDRFGKEKTICSWWGAPPTAVEVKARQRQDAGGTRETFGVSGRVSGTGADFEDRPEILKPVSQMIKRRRSCWSTLKRFLFGY